MNYTIQKNMLPNELNGQWNGSFWDKIPALKIGHFHSKSSSHRPETQAKLCFNDGSLFLIFQVHDRFIRAAHTTTHSRVCEDSCVEFFVQPYLDKGYFNFEVNCGGTLLARYNPPPSKTTPGETDRSKTLLAASWVEQIPIFHSLPKRIDPEIDQPTTWVIEYEIPFALFENFIGPMDLAKDEWRGNLYKCGDETSHPHWATWNPIGEKLNFHNTEPFGTFKFK